VDAVPRLVRIAGPALLLIVAFAAMLWAIAFGGAAAPQQVFDPGAVVRYGLIISTLFTQLGMSLTLGSLVLACIALNQGPEFGKALDIASGAAAFWAISSAVTGFFTFMSLSDKPIAFDQDFGNILGQFLVGGGNQTIGPSWLATTLIAAVVTVLCFAVRNRTALVLVTIFAGVGFVPMALQGHSADAAGHDAATSSLGLHVVFAGIWLGGLLTLVLLRKTLQAEGRVGIVLSRYSTLALISFIVVACSGYVNAALRVGTLPQLLTTYGILVLVKVIALSALGLFGLAQRSLLVRKMQDAKNGGSKFFWWMVAAELGFMGLAFGVAAALAKTATPVSQAAVTNTPAAYLTGEQLPPELTFARYFTEWRFDLIWVLIVAFLAFFYVAGVVRLHRRGDRWPIHRTVFWLLGLALLFYVTNGPVNEYERYLFSVHMLGHMLLGMLVPLLLVPAAPITLALRTIDKRTDGSRGMREWIMIVVHSPVSRVLTNPIVTAIIFAGSLLAFYYTPLFSWATTDHIGHEWMIVHFLIAGYLFVQSLIGVDPVPYRASYPIRLITLFATMGFHAFFGVTLTTSTGLLLANWYGAMGRVWGQTPLGDQQTGGGIALSVAEIPTVILAIIVAIMWARSDERDAKRLDRKADRDGDADLEAYNRMLAGRSRQA
jgi:cytochrome c oxidase assembly factor CtaG/putative copper export protein